MTAGRTPQGALRFIAGFLGFAVAFAIGPGAASADEEIYQSKSHAFRVTPVVSGLEHPWGMAFLPDGALLVTERPGRLRLVRDGALIAQPIGGVPKVFASGQGGLLDVALHPDFASNKLVYLSFSKPTGGGKSLTAVLRGRLEGMNLTDTAVIFEARPETGGGNHFGSRLAFGAGNILYITAGERNERKRAQRLDDLGGKVVRLNDDGSIPADNPFVGKDGARPEIFTYGHRNPQGLLVHPETGDIWEIEHGPRGGDEINLLSAGANYGWPIVTKGREYSGLAISDGKSKPGMVDPARFWVPSISPSGIAFYAGAAFPGWRGCLFIGALSGEALVRLEMNGREIAGEERLLEGKVGRIRDVSAGPDGRLYLLIDDGDGALLRLDPA